MRPPPPVAGRGAGQLAAVPAGVSFPPSAASRAAAAAVHAYTAAGGVLAFFALAQIAAGRFEAALLLLAAAFAIDGTDGVLARRLRVKAVLPGFDGAALDLVIDFVTYAVAPLLLLWRAGLLPQPGWCWAMLALGSALYDFGNRHPLKDRGLYTGLPAVWNFYAFHVYYVRPGEGVQIAVLLALVVLTFAPIHFVALSRLRYLRGVSLSVVALYLAAIVAVIAGLVADRRGWALAALAAPAWYLALSLRVHLRHRRGAAVGLATQGVSA